jgi:hypothetical protein
MSKPHLLIFWKSVLVLTIAFTVASMIQMVGLTQTYNINILQSNWIILLSTIATIVFIVVMLVILLSTHWKDRLLETPEAVMRLSKSWRIFAGCVFLLFGCYAPESQEIKPSILRNPVILSLLLITPVWMITRTDVSAFVWDKGQADRTLTLIQQNVEDISQQGGEVLLISQRQLLALKMVKTALVPEYEQDFLMEMVMSHNQPYLEQFQEDLREQRFAGIVADVQNVHFYGRTRAFGEENDLWIQDVSIPLLCYYESAQAFADLSTVVYIPRSQPCE